MNFNNGTTQLGADSKEIYRIPGQAIIYSNGPFSMTGKIGIGGYGPGTPGSQITSLLHELAHMIVNPQKGGTKYLIPDDDPKNNPGLSAKNTEAVLKACKDQIFETVKKL
jgi:hypothetical protein